MKKDQNDLISGQTKTIRVFISYSHDAEEHYDRVKNLSDRLSKEGIYSIIDQYVDNYGPEEGWASWSDKNILGADYIFIVCTEEYYRRTRGETEWDVGRGAKWEFQLILKLLYKDGSQNLRLIPVLFNKNDKKYIPERLSDLNYYCLESEAEYKKMFKRITGQIKKNEIEKEVKIEPDGELPPKIPKIEDGKKAKKPEIRRYPERMIKYKYLIYISGIIAAAIAAFIFLKSSILGWQNERLIASAETFINSKDWEKAGDALNKAEKNRGRATVEITALYKKIREKQIKAMKDDFESLKNSLSSVATNKEKIEKCHKFLAKHEGIPGNGEKTAIMSDVNNSISKLKVAVTLEEEYRNLLIAAGEYLKKGDYTKALDSLEKAKKIKGGDTDETTALYKKIREKQIKAMKDDFESLKNSLSSVATNKEKIEKCREFLRKHQNTPGNADTNKMRNKVNTEIKDHEQCQNYIDTVNNLIKSKEYEKAKKELNKFRKIKDSEELKRLSEEIEKEWTKAIKDLSQYPAFKSEYPQSGHLQDLIKRLKDKDKNLPPEKYWDESLEKNEKDYYEYTFIIGKEKNQHRMIYVTGKMNFWIDKYEVSWVQYRKFLKGAMMPFPTKSDDTIIHSDDEYPAVITYEQADEYCKKYGLRIPNEDEWEYAAGKGTFIYPWGNEPPDDKRANFYGSLGKNNETVPVYRFNDKNSVSVFGAVQMAGNVWEWVIIEGGETVKGGGFFSNKNDLKIKNRPPKGISRENGLRCKKDEK